MSGEVFAKMLKWISDFIAKLVAMFKNLGEMFSDALN